MNLSQLEQEIISDRWSFLDNAVYTPVNGGTSNTVYLVDTATAQFILKFYSPTVSDSQINYEHSLLRILQQSSLSFKIPAPIPTQDNQTLVAIETKQQNYRIALLPKLSGKTLDRQNDKQIYAAGLTLGELHHKLILFDSNGKLAQLPAWGNLSKIHHLIQKPQNLPQILNLGLEEELLLRKMVDRLIEIVPCLYADLPQQTIHADYISANILVEENIVAGILDFEYATYDLRLLDFLGSLAELASVPWRCTNFKDRVRNFSQGYQKNMILNSLEIEAIPIVWQLQKISTLIYWTGCLLENKAQRSHVTDAVMDTLKFQSYLKDFTKLISM
ncbi:homoserine kinase (plasmid) [Chondrocystis sp. NIES-4102]|nr:homoserine kinase [Chondrocystis sp. NIES-4102]